MAAQKFIPELHDIGKLASEAVGLPEGEHTFDSFDFALHNLTPPASPSWWGQFHHAKKPRYPYDIAKEDINAWTFGNLNTSNKQDVFLLILADHLASSTSRAIYGEFPGNAGQEGVVKLWNRNFYAAQVQQGKQWAAFQTPADVTRILAEIQNCLSSQEFLNKYSSYLLLTPEDKFIPRNVTSLFTHVELVGKIYRILKRTTHITTQPDGTIAIKPDGEPDEKKVITIAQAEGSRITTEKAPGKSSQTWQARLVKCQITFPHAFVRLQDINLLRKQIELIADTKRQCPDEVLFAASDFFTLFLPVGANLPKIIEPFSASGFHVKIVETTADLGILSSILDRKTLNARKDQQRSKESQQRVEALQSRGTHIRLKHFLPNTPEKLSYPLCDICQQVEGKERVKENIREWVCEKCQTIRNIGVPFEKYAVWEREGVNKVCWFKLTLEQEKLEHWLTDYAFSGYVLGIPDASRYKINVLVPLREEYRRLQAMRDTLDAEINQLFEDMKNGGDSKILGPQKGKKQQERKALDKELQACQAKLTPYEEEFRPLALQIDFNNDYNALVKAFWVAFQDTEDMQMPLKEYHELGVFKYSPKLIRDVIETYRKVCAEFFPDCAADDQSPISLSLSIANIKYPIRDHWKYFEQTEKSWLNLRQHNVFEDAYTRQEVTTILNNLPETLRAQSYLHNLSAIQEKLQSDILLQIEVFNNRTQYPQPYQVLQAGISPSRFLNFYKTVKGMKRV